VAVLQAHKRTASSVAVLQANKRTGSSVAVLQANSGAAQHKASAGHDEGLLRLQFLAFRRTTLPSPSASESIKIIRNVGNYRTITTSHVSLPK
jgi:hypothetical protein